MGQIVHWVSTGQVASNKIIHVGIPQARAIVRNKAVKKTEFGLAYLISRLGGGYVLAERIMANTDERQMPLRALAGYRRLFGPDTPPELVVYDRGGDCTRTREQLARAGVKQVGLDHFGKHQSGIYMPQGPEFIRCDYPNPLPGADIQLIVQIQAIEQGL
ncbi:hypothetical protein C2W62_20485 [Candidatus Entotheonella serta]|nr:hypothetical protein C2W62_20485 [Candidatus Entotheonella serta]